MRVVNEHNEGTVLMLAREGLVLRLKRASAKAERLRRLSEELARMDRLNNELVEILGNPYQQE